MHRARNDSCGEERKINSPLQPFLPKLEIHKSPPMVSVEVKNLILHAFHGVHEDEQKTGSDYEVNLEVHFHENGNDFESLDDTINYVTLLDIIKQRMAVKNSLLEKVADGIIRKIKHQCPTAKEIRLSIYKLQPPVENFQGKLGVTMYKRFDD